MLKAETLGTIFSYMVTLLVLLCWSLLMIRFIRDKFAPIQTVQAMVVDKYKTKTVSKIPGTFQRERYIIVFLVGEKKIAFDVSEFSFHGYAVKEKGTLKYKGKKIIKFS